MFRDTSIKVIGVTFEDAKVCYQVNCGCKRFVFVGQESLTEFLTSYIAAPGEVEREWYKKHGDVELANPITAEPREEIGTPSAGDGRE